VVEIEINEEEAVYRISNSFEHSIVKRFQTEKI